MLGVQSKEVRFLSQGIRDSMRVIGDIEILVKIFVCLQNRLKVCFIIAIDKCSDGAKMGRSETIHHHQMRSIQIDVMLEALIHTGHRWSVVVFDSLLKTVI